VTDATVDSDREVCNRQNARPARKVF
jgi:hypothetical protein